MSARAKGKKGGKKPKSRSRRLSLKAALCLAVLLALWGLAGEWYVHHSRAWLAQQDAALPSFVSLALYAFGNPLADLTDALDLTGHDAVYEYDTSAPEGEVLFAGVPVANGLNAPRDIQVIDRGSFKIGWSPSLRHPVWCAYHVTREAKYPLTKRPSFLVDRGIPSAPHPDSYRGYGYDRGHLAPNYAITTRYGEGEQRKTFMMGNIAPQSAALNRGVWREIEHRIADLWTARYGEVWVIVGCIPSRTSEKIGASGVDVPSAYWQMVLAQEGMDVRAMAFLVPQNVCWGAWPARQLVSIDEIEELSGLDLNPEMPSFIQDPLEADVPTRTWPIRVLDLLTLFTHHYCTDS